MAGHADSADSTERKVYKKMKDGEHCIVEPFLAEGVTREQAAAR